ncbi:MAG: 16S rRNA (cytosine(1402)-N(4))-methyltransferase RsmH [Propionibacteriaceae bacterium]
MAQHSDTHIPVMCDRIVELLAPALQRPGAVHIDCTTGLGGHIRAIAERNPQARIIGLDRDADAIAVAKERLAYLGDRVTFVQAVYDELPEVLDDLAINTVDSVLADLGLSSLQIDRRERGFAYAVDAPLDMRMDTRQDNDAADILNTYSQADLVRILRSYGEEKFASRIVAGIISARQEAPFVTSARLVEVISSAIPAAARYSGGHPAKRTFQALRIEVNSELVALENMVPAAIARLGVGGRMAVLSYHSLEDRLIKQNFAKGAAIRAPRHLPVVPKGMGPELALITRGAEKPSAQECAENPRAASARLRVAERIEAA